MRYSICSALGGVSPPGKVPRKGYTARLIQEGYPISALHTGYFIKVTAILINAIIPM